MLTGAQTEDPRHPTAPHSTNAGADLGLTRDYLLSTCASEMGKAVDEMTPFEDAYARTDWSRFSQIPAFEATNRINAYGAYLTLGGKSLAVEAHHVRPPERPA